MILTLLWMLLGRKSSLGASFQYVFEVPCVSVYKLVWHVFTCMLSIMYNGLKLETSDA